MAELIRINKFLAQCGVGSRRECDKKIAAGHISVNGTVTTELGLKIDPEKDEILFDGENVEQVNKKYYIAYHKRPGTVATKSDPEKRETVFDALQKQGLNASLLNYIGRLDMFSEGLLLFTNDGELIHALTHPKFHIKKVYLIKTDTELTETDIRKMVDDGIEDDGQILRAGAIRRKNDLKGNWVEVDLFEGKNRQIRRMFSALGYTILKLKRIQFGGVKLRDLPAGKYRELEEREIKNLKSKGFSVKKGRG